MSANRRHQALLVKPTPTSILVLSEAWKKPPAGAASNFPMGRSMALHCWYGRGSSVHWESRSRSTVLRTEKTPNFYSHSLLSGLF